jgi:hypothetical protein
MFGFFGKKNNKKTNEPIEITADEKIDAENENEGELIAVIAAAVASFLQKPISGFRVVSFKERSRWKFFGKFY